MSIDLMVPIGVAVDILKRLLPTAVTARLSMSPVICATVFAYSRENMRHIRSAALEGIGNSKTLPQTGTRPERLLRTMPWTT